MLGHHPILGSLLFVSGLILIAFNKEIARQLEEIQKLSRIWDLKNYAYILWRTLSIVIGAALVLTSSFVLLNSL